MLAGEISLAELMDRHAQPGHVMWIGLRSKRGAPMTQVTEAKLVADRGIIGDRSADRAGGKRQVTLIQAEHLPVIAKLLNMENVDPEALRRNIVVANLNLVALRNRRFMIGQCQLEGTGYCHPCSRMEENLGRGGYNAVRGHGGITAKIIHGERISVADTVEYYPEQATT